MPNATMAKFGYPDTLVAETAHWTVQLRPQQPTLGALVLVCKEPAESFSALSRAAFADLKDVTEGVERVLAAFAGYERLNYLMLMMVDPDVHFHVIPRYAEARHYAGLAFPDAGWPGPPALGEAVVPDGAMRARMAGDLRQLWAAS